jgi:hypothetical protein
LKRFVEARDPARPDADYGLLVMEEAVADRRERVAAVRGAFAGVRTLVVGLVAPVGRPEGVGAGPIGMSGRVAAALDGTVIMRCAAAEAEEEEFSSLRRR